MHHPIIRATTVIAVVWLAVLVPALHGQQQPPPGSRPPPPSQTGPPAPSGSLDAFMQRVLARRDVNRQTLNEYILDETEGFEVLGPGRMPFVRKKREYTWYVRDGMHVRSPVRFDGVAVGPEARDAYERRWIERDRRRQERKKDDRRDGEISISGDVNISAGGSTEPRFVSEAYFMDFKFEAGNYYLAGREQIEGHDVLRIEYYPTRLFNADDDEKTPREMKRKDSREERRDRKAEEDIDRKMNKTALVTLWVDPAEHQIVKYTFDNVWLDFLPVAWLVRVDDLRASMTMGQPFPGVWLPRGMNIHAGVTLANGSFDAGYTRSFSEYREATVTSTIRAPKVARAVPQVPGVAEVGDGAAGHGPYVAPGEGLLVAADQPVETVREVRVHGNASLLDAEVLKLAGIGIGDPIGAESLKTIEQRLKDSHWFESIEVRKRYRSLDDPSDVAIVLIVHERPGVTSASTDVRPIARPFRRITSRLMFLPILSYADGYGLTYGGRVSTIDVLGIGERLSVPLTWGGTRRAALEFDRTFDRGPLTRILSSAGIWSRENPHYGFDDQRVELKARAERQITRYVRTGVETARSTVSFGDLDDRIWTLGANAALDTRGDPAFPGNAIYLEGGWSALQVKGLPRINRYASDARGYLRVWRQTVVAGRAQYLTSDGALPTYERQLLGGASTLRGFRAGAFSGDRLLATSVELRVPITSVISGARLGVSAFVDAGKTVDYGVSLKDAEWQRGVGGGIFIIASPLKINLGVARGLDGGATRLHLSSGFSF